MKYVSYLSVSAKVVLTAGVFIFISGPEDYLWVPVLTALGFFLSVLVALYLIHVKYQVSFQWPPLAEIRQSLVEGWFVFLSQMKITLFSSSNIVILGMMVGPVAVGYYVAAEKIMRTLALAQTPITSALFPLIAKKMATDKVAAITKLKKLLIWAVCFISAFWEVCMSFQIALLLFFMVRRCRRALGCSR